MVEHDSVCAECPCGGVRSFLGTSGQNVCDIKRYSSMDDHLEILENTLRLRHLAPTAPDTLGNTHSHSLTLTPTHTPTEGVTVCCDSSLSQAAIRSTRRILSSWRSVLMSTSVAAPPPSSPNASQV